VKPKILFLGTPEFAVPSLDMLVRGGYPVIGVVTQPARPKGRGRKVVPPPVKVCAEKAHIAVFQPARVRDAEFVDMARLLAPDMVVLAAFGQILPKELIDLPPLGCLNVHPSLLPKYRGAAPINWTLIHGEEKTGVTIMRMDEGVDTGDILLQEETAIEPDEVFDTLHDRLAGTGAALLLRAAEGAAEGTLAPVPQPRTGATYAPRLTKQSGHIDWRCPARDIVNLIRGLSSHPGAYAFWQDKMLKIYYAVPGPQSSGEKLPGTIGGLMEAGLQVTAGDGHVYLQEVQLEGKKRMFIDEFLRGHGLSHGELLE
jgi:methionyl-tRNA formyltransferase